MFHADSGNSASIVVTALKETPKHTKCVHARSNGLMIKYGGKKKCGFMKLYAENTWRRAGRQLEAQAAGNAPTLELYRLENRYPNPGSLHN